MAELASYLIGIDTGGTYTDAAVIDQANHKILATAKALTTKGDLSIGVSEAMRQALGDLPAKQIKLVSVSTTLATNAVVEGHGSSVAAILIGFDAAMVEKTGIAKAFPDMPIIVVSGGHDHNGEEKFPLQIVQIEKAIKDVQGKVSAFAIAASFAVRNPEHETRIALHSRGG